MNRILPAFAALIALSAPARAAYLIFPEGDAALKGDTKSAYEAYKKGNYTEAMRMFKTEAGRGDKDADYVARVLGL